MMDRRTPLRMAMLTALSMAALTCAAATADPSKQSTPVRRAVLIGVNEYLAEEFPDLRGAVNDVNAMHEVLTERFGFTAENVTVLTDAGATRAAILEALERLAEVSGPQDVVYIHFSGHGSQIQDFSGDESDDGHDETIVPYDGRTDAVPDITDDELGAILSELRAETALIVLDSCHAGTATRGGVVTRSIPADRRVGLYKRPQDAVAKRAIVRLDLPVRYALLTGAAANENALDGPLGGEYRGFFSFALANALGASKPDASLREVHDDVMATFRRLSEEFGGLRLPEPQFEAASGVVDRPVLRGADRSEGGPSLPPAIPESVLSLPSSAAVAVRWEKVDPEVRARLEGEIRRRFPNVKFVGQGEFARFVLEVEDGSCKVFDATGLDPVEEFSAAAVAETGEKLARLFERSLNASSLLALANPVSDMRLDLHVVDYGEGTELHIRKSGEARSHRNSLMLEIRSSVDSYITIVDVDPGGGINVLFPNSYAKPGFLPKGLVREGRTVRVPDSLTGGNRAGFFWDYQPPAGVDTIQVFASTDLATAGAIREWIAGMPGVTTRGSEAPAAKTARDGHERLALLRSELARRVHSRGVGVVADETPSHADEDVQAGGSHDAAAQTTRAVDWTSAAVQIRIGR